MNAIPTTLTRAPVLVIDDHPIVLQGCRRVLEDAGVERIVREEEAIFGELPPFEPGAYTFLADYVPWGGGDGMEHRNSTVVADRTATAVATLVP